MIKIKRYFVCLLFPVIIFSLPEPVLAQCSAGINTFPYQEGFEAGMGNWLVSPGSINSDWAWGTPSKFIISSAGGGNKCWITGGLSGDSYQNGEDSYLQSPCFDISSLMNPIISFKVFWETETDYDGAGFQYSLDQGGSWENLGSYSDGAGCVSANWFNDPSIRYLSTGEGWSGSSGQWLTASHDLSIARGARSITFRFVFGAGTRNNSYNGFALDDIFIGEKAVSADFSFSCQGNMMINFAGVASACSNDYSWNFGDAASGNNTSNMQNPTHTFSGPGTFAVSLTTGGKTTAKQVTLLGVAVKGKDITCHGAANGTAMATVTGGSAANLLWNTSPAQSSAAISNLPPGTYTVTASATDACAASASVVIAEPGAISTGIVTTNEICGDKKGAASATVSGGVMPYTYLWSNNETTSSITSLTANTYTLTVKDAQACVATSGAIVIKDSSRQVPVFLGRDTSFCQGQHLVLHPGEFSSYLWQDHSTSASYEVSATGNYSVQVTDANGCKGGDSIQVTVDCSDIFFPSAFTPNGDARNDGFGPVGNVGGARRYSFSVYNRWGQRVFYSTDPFQKWDGRLKGMDSQADIFTWFASYAINTGPMLFKKGTVMVIR